MHNNGWVSICIYMYTSSRKFPAYVFTSTFSLSRCTHTHIHLHTLTTLTHAGLTLLTEHGDIYTLGCAEQGQLGRVPECFSSRGGQKGTSLLLRPDIVRFRVKKGAGKPKFWDVFCSPYHIFEATQRGEVYVWGLNNYGQLCTGDSRNRYQPELLEGGLIGGRGLGVAKDFCVASGGHHTVVCCDGEVFTCGRKEYGRLGLGKDTEEPNLPTQVEGLKGVKVVTVAAGGACSFVVTATGELYGWGWGRTCN